MGNEGWINKRFDQCAELIRETVDPKELNNVPYIGLEHIAQESLCLVGYGTSGDVNSAKSRFKKGDILFGKLRPYFRKVVIAPFDGVCSTDIWVVRSKPETDRKFLFYWMASHEFIEESTRSSEGTRMPRAQWEFVSRIEKLVPQQSEQRAIGSILGALDDKIELNRQMCKTLEDTAQAIFKSWFVDFDPVHAKAEGKQPQGMNPEIAALFPDFFEETEKGKIPKGWSISRLGDHFNLTMGQSPPGSTYNEEGIGVPFFQGRTDFGFRFPLKRVFCTAPTRYADRGDTLVSVRAPVGDINMAIERCAIGRGVAAVRHMGGSSIFTYYSMKQLRNNFVSFEAEGSVFGSITKGDFLKLPVIAPPDALIVSYDRLFAVLDNSIKCNELQSISLSTIRDSLLHKLISGELRISDAERIVERSVR